MFIVKGAVYVTSSEGLTKCILHKQGDCYYLQSTKATLEALPKDYSCVTMDELVARYGDSAVEDDSIAVMSKEK